MGINTWMMRFLDMPDVMTLSSSEVKKPMAFRPMGFRATSTTFEKDLFLPEKTVSLICLSAPKMFFAIGMF